MAFKKYVRIVLLLPLLFSFLSVSGFAETKGLFIGTAKYTNGNNPLPDTRFDATDLRNSMVSNGIVPEDKTRLMTGINTKAQILDAIRNQAVGMGPGDTLIITNSSHGSSAGTLCAADANITPAEFAAALQGSGVGNVVIANDSCHSERFQVNVPGKNIAHINAAEGDKVGWSSTGNTAGMGHKNGVLTRQMIEGLEGNKADINGDGQITTLELAAYARANTKMDEANQNPHNYRNTSRTQGPNHKGNDIPLVTGNEQKPPEDVTEGLEVMVPRVVGEKVDAAQGMLSADGLTGSVQPYSGDKGNADNSWVGLVIRTSPAQGTRVKKGESVILYVPNEEDLADVPNVIGMKASEAAGAIEAAGLKYSCRNKEHPSNSVIIQFPAGGTKLVKGGTVVFDKGDANKVAVPFVVGETKETAESMVTAQKLSPVSATAKPGNYSTNPPFEWKSKVWKCAPAQGSWQVLNTNVNLSVAPDDAVDVPNIAGMTDTEARAAITGAGLVMSEPFVEAKSAVGPRGVIHFTPKPQAYTGDTIRVQVEYPEVPSLVGKTQEEATALCEAAKLGFTAAKKIIAGNTDFDKVAAQGPGAGQKAKWGDVVTGTFPESKTRVPALLNMDRGGAEGALTNAGLTGSFSEEKPSPDQYGSFPPPDISGKVWKQSPDAGAEVDVNSAVNATLGPGGGVAVPNLSGMSEGDARAALAGIGLVMAIGEQTQTSMGARGVFGWAPEDYAYQGDTVTVQIEYPEVPNVIGWDEETASGMIYNAGLVPDIGTEIKENIPDGEVFSQSPGAGTRANLGDTVSATAAFAPEPPEDEDEDEDEEEDLDDIFGPEEEGQTTAGGSDAPPPPGWDPAGENVSGPSVPSPESQEANWGAAGESISNAQENEPTNNQSNQQPQSPYGPYGPVPNPYDEFGIPTPPPVTPGNIFEGGEGSSGGSTPSSGGESGHSHGPDGSDL